MNCHSCAARNPADAHFCSNCGVRIADDTTGSHAAIAGLVASVEDATTAPRPPTTPEPYEPDRRYPTVAPPTIGEPAAPVAATPPGSTAQTTTSPPGTPFSGGPAPTGPQVPPPPQSPTRRPSALPIIASVAAVLALVGAGAIILFAMGDDDSDSIVTPTAATVPSTAAPGPTVVETTVATTVAPAETTPGSTATAAPSAPATTATTLPGDPAAVPPPPPEPGPVDAPGSPQVLSNALPSGPDYADVEASFEVAQRFGDALALADWPLARQLSPELAGFSDADFVRGYGNTNRVSLMLRDARPDGPAYELLVVSVAVANGGTQTSLFCLTWAVDPVARTVDQRDGNKLATWDGNAQPEAIRNDPAAMEVVNSCTYP